MQGCVEPTFSLDWFSNNIPHWETILSPLAGQRDLKFLEIGVFEGRATHWLLNNILTDETARIHCVDTFAGSSEHQAGMSHAIQDLSVLQQTFEQNVAAYGKKVVIDVGVSQELLRTYALDSFDFVYVDGSHRAADVLEDAILAFRLLKAGGVMILDDYEWKTHFGTLDNPRQGIDAFLDIFADQYDLLDKWYQVAIRKH